MWITITWDGHLAEHNGIPTYRELSDAVGGMIEAVCLDHQGSTATMYVNEEGKLDGLPLNRAATALGRGQLMDDDYVAGTAVFTGCPDDNGDDTELPAAWVARFRSAAR